MKTTFTVKTILFTCAITALTGTTAIAQEAISTGFTPIAGAALGAAGGITDAPVAVNGAETAGNIFNNPVLPKLTLQAAGPLALGLGAIILVGAISGGGSTGDTSQ